MSYTLTELKKIKEIFNGRGVYRAKGCALALEIVEGVKNGKLPREAYQSLKLFLKYNSFWVQDGDLVFSPGDPKRLREVYLKTKDKDAFLERLYLELTKFIQGGKL